MAFDFGGDPITVDPITGNPTTSTFDTTPAQHGTNPSAPAPTPDPYVAPDTTTQEPVPVPETTTIDTTTTETTTTESTFNLDEWLAQNAGQLGTTYDTSTKTTSESALDWIRANMPWAESLGLLDTIKGLITDDSTAEEIVATVRQTSQYKTQFTGMVDANGQRRFASERQYIDTVTNYRDVLKNFGMWDPNNDTPMDYVALFDQQIDPNELNQRLTVYTELDRNSQATKDAFYVYAGMDVTTEDLYQAIVSPEYQQELTDTYNQSISGNAFDYDKFIQRATQRGLERTTKLLQDMQQQGLVTGQALSKLYSTDPNFARDVMGALGGKVDAGRTLNLDELLATFDEAMIASAATESGLEMPTKERIQQLREAGVKRAQAMSAYGKYAASRGMLQGVAARANRGAKDISQGQWEDATLLGKTGTQAEISRLLAQESALGQAGGGFSSQLKGNRITQAGRSLG